MASHPILPHLKRLLRPNVEMRCTLTELLGEIEAKATVKQRFAKGWPQSAETLSRTLKQIDAELVAAGIAVRRPTSHNGGRYYRFLRESPRAASR